MEQDSGQGRKVSRFTREQTAETGQEQAGSKTGRQAWKKRWKVTYNTEHNLTLSQPKSRAYTLRLIDKQAASAADQWAYHR